MDLDLALGSYRNRIKNNILNDFNEKRAKFSIVDDKHPSLWKIVKDIVNNELNYSYTCPSNDYKWSTIDGEYKPTYSCYIIGSFEHEKLEKQNNTVYMWVLYLLYHMLCLLLCLIFSIFIYHMFRVIFTIVYDLYVENKVENKNVRGKDVKNLF